MNITTLLKQYPPSGPYSILAASRGNSVSILKEGDVIGCVVEVAPHFNVGILYDNNSDNRPTELDSYIVIIDGEITFYLLTSDFPQDEIKRVFPQWEIQPVPSGREKFDTLARIRQFITNNYSVRGDNMDEKVSNFMTFMTTSLGILTHLPHQNPDLSHLIPVAFNESVNLDAIRDRFLEAELAAGVRMDDETLHNIVAAIDRDRDNRQPVGENDISLKIAVPSTLREVVNAVRDYYLDHVSDDVIHVANGAFFEIYNKLEKALSFAEMGRLEFFSPMTVEKLVNKLKSREVAKNYVISDGDLQLLIESLEMNRDQTAPTTLTIPHDSSRAIMDHLMDLSHVEQHIITADGVANLIEAIQNDLDALDRLTTEQTCPSELVQIDGENVLESLTHHDSSAVVLNTKQIGELKPYVNQFLELTRTTDVFTVSPDEDVVDLLVAHQPNNLIIQRAELMRLQKRVRDLLRVDYPILDCSVFDLPLVIEHLPTVEQDQIFKIRNFDVLRHTSEILERNVVQASMEINPALRTNRDGSVTVTFKSSESLLTYQKFVQKFESVYGWALPVDDDIGEQYNALSIIQMARDAQADQLFQTRLRTALEQNGFRVTDMDPQVIIKSIVEKNQRDDERLLEDLQEQYDQLVNTIDSLKEALSLDRESTIGQLIARVEELGTVASRDDSIFSDFKKRLIELDVDVQSDEPGQLLESVVRRLANVTSQLREVRSKCQRVDGEGQNVNSDSRSSLNSTVLPAILGAGVMWLFNNRDRY